MRFPILVVVLGLGAACADAGGAIGTGLPALSGGAGGAAGMSAGQSGSSTAPAPGAGGLAGTVAKPMGGGAGAGAGATAGGMASAGTGGATSAGTGGSTPGGGGDCGPAAFACRGEAPTEESANGNSEGPYAVENYTSGYMDGDFSDATMWYPTDATPPFGCVAVVPGFLSPQSSIRGWGPFLASHGIVTITIGVPGGDQPNMRAMSLMSALETCKGENMRSGSPLVGKIATDHLGVSGWSMGGGGTLIAAAGNPELKAAVSFAAWGPSGGSMNKVPTLMFEATADFLAAGMSDGFFASTPDTTPKMLFEVSGSSHNVANDPGNHDGTIGLYGLSWWKVFLEGDERYRKFLTGPAPSITTMKFDHNLM